MRYVLIMLLLMMPGTVVSAQEDPVEDVSAESVDMPDFDQMRQQLRDDYLSLKQEVEDDYTLRINALNPGPTELQLQMEKRALQEEFRKRKQAILDDYQEQVRNLRDEEAELKGELDRYYYEEEPPEPRFKPRPARQERPAEEVEEEQRRGSRTIPPFTGKSAIGTKPQFKGRGRAGGLVKTKKRQKQLQQREEQQDEDKETKKVKRRSINDARSMFEKNRR